MQFSYLPAVQKANFNTLEIIMAECSTDANDHDDWHTPFTYTLPSNQVSNRNEAENYIRGLSFIAKVIEKSRAGYGEPISGVSFEDESGLIEDIVADESDMVITFTVAGKEYFYPFEYDNSMPTEDGRYFAGIKLEALFFYDENGDKFEMQIIE